MKRNSSKKDKLEPMVKISRKCFSCGNLFILPHPSAPDQLCDECKKSLSEIIMSYRSGEKIF